MHGDGYTVRDGPGSASLYVSEGRMSLLAQGVTAGSGLGSAVPKEATCRQTVTHRLCHCLCAVSRFWCPERDVSSHRGIPFLRARSRLANRDRTRCRWLALFVVGESARTPNLPPASNRTTFSSWGRTRQSTRLACAISAAGGDCARGRPGTTTRRRVGGRTGIPGPATARNPEQPGCHSERDRRPPEPHYGYRECNILACAIAPRVSEGG